MAAAGEKVSVLQTFGPQEDPQSLVDSWTSKHMKTAVCKLKDKKKKTVHTVGRGK